MSTIGPIDPAAPATGPAPTRAAVPPVSPPAAPNDHDGDDAASAVKSTPPRGVGERLDKTA